MTLGPRLHTVGRTDPGEVEHELWRLAQEILSLGLSVVLDFGLWARIERDEMRSAAGGLGVDVELHYLDVPTDELWRRIEAELEATLGPLPDSPRRLRRVANACSKRPMLSSRPCSTPRQSELLPQIDGDATATPSSATRREASVQMC
jgi:hypothetical protein